MISTTGRSPDCAAPIAIPQIAASLIGVLRTRSAPNSSDEPCGRSPRPALGHVLAQHEHARVGAHRLRERRP